MELACERAVDPSGGTPFESLGFTVEGIAAWRQWGRTSLIVDGDWQVTWNDATELRRVDPPANVRQQGFVAAFAYDAQPASLPLQVLPLRSRVVIEPEYRYDVGGTRVTLDARFRVAARGAPVSSIAFAIDPAWSIDEVGPAGAVDVAAVTAEAGEIVIPFAQALAGDTVVEVRASRAIRKEDERVAWRLPVPRADLVGPALVVIASQTDIELLPANDGISGLVRQTAAAVPLVDADRTAMVYRLDAAEGSFAAVRRFLPRRVEATVLAQATLDAAEIVVEETIRLNVLHVPLEFIELLVPDTVAATGSFEVRQDDELLDPSEVPAAGDDVRDDAVPVARMRAILPTPLLGGGDVTVRFRLPTPTIPPESTVALDLPLALPVGANVSRQTVTISALESLAVAVRGDAWRRDVGPAGGPLQAWSAPKSQREFPLALSVRSTDPARTMVVEAAWLQTRLLPGVREDIRRYVISAAADRIVVSLPAAADAVAGGSGEAAGEMAGCEVQLDGDTVPAAVRTGGRVVVDLPQVDPRGAGVSTSARPPRATRAGPDSPRGSACPAPSGWRPRCSSPRCWSGGSTGRSTRGPTSTCWGCRPTGRRSSSGGPRRWDGGSFPSHRRTSWRAGSRPSRPGIAPRQRAATRRPSPCHLSPRARSSTRVSVRPARPRRGSCPPGSSSSSPPARRWPAASAWSTGRSFVAGSWPPWPRSASPPPPHRTWRRWRAKPHCPAPRLPRSPGVCMPSRGAFRAAAPTTGRRPGCRRVR